MAIALPALAVAFTAFCIWLTVRIVNRRERWAKWTLAAVVMGFPMLYVASFGPACWLATPNAPGEGTTRLIRLVGVYRVAPRIYWPFGTILKDGPRPVAEFVNWYATLGAKLVYVPIGPENTGLLYTAYRE